MFHLAGCLWLRRGLGFVVIPSAHSQELHHAAPQLFLQHLTHPIPLPPSSRPCQKKDGFGRHPLCTPCIDYLVPFGRLKPHWLLLDKKNQTKNQTCNRLNETKIEVCPSPSHNSRFGVSAGNRTWGDLVSSPHVPVTNPLAYSPSIMLFGMGSRRSG